LPGRAGKKFYCTLCQNQKTKYISRRDAEAQRKPEFGWRKAPENLKSKFVVFAFFFRVAEIMPAFGFLCVSAREYWF